MGKKENPFLDENSVYVQTQGCTGYHISLKKAVELIIIHLNLHYVPEHTSGGYFEKPEVNDEEKKNEKNI